MKIERRFTRPDRSVYDQFEYALRSSTLRNPDGSTVFEMRDIEVPAHWSQVATDILAQKYFRKAGVPQTNEDGTPKLNEDGAPVLGPERTARQVVHRLVGCWADWGRRYNYFDTEDDAAAFYDEAAYMLLAQMAAPNSPQWFNTGLAWSYGVNGPAQGHFHVDPDTGKLVRSKDAYTHPQPHACFIQSVEDDLVNEGGIFDLITREARIFKYGSGTGSNFSNLRAEREPLSGGGVSSGLMSFLRVADRAAGAVKSGGTTRRAAKMVILNADHPDIEAFVDWKMIEEQKVAALVSGSKILHTFLNEIMVVASRDGIDYTTPGSELHGLVQRALNRGVPLNAVVRALELVKQGRTSIDVREYDTHYEGEAYLTVSGQNSNNSVRLTEGFMKAMAEDADWNLTRRTDGAVMKTIKARDLWRKINYAAWSCADPGLQFHTTINEWHTCPKDGEINASNPCSEYMFLDDTACFAPETRISTPEGLRSVEELYQMQERGVRATITTDLYSEHDHRRVTAHRPAYITKVGEKQSYRMTLRDGRSIRVTDDHRFLTDGGEWKRVDELQVGADRVEIRRSGNPVAFTSSPADVRRWQALGWLAGDGVFSKGNVAMVFGPSERATAEEMTAELNRMIEEAELWRRNEEDQGEMLILEPTAEYGTDNGTPLVAEPRRVNISTQVNGVMQAASKSRSLVHWLETEYGMTQGTATVKDVPSRIHYIAEDLKVAYLQGLFSADGCIRKSATEDEVMLASSSPEMLRSVQLLLSDLGITSRITWTHPTGRANAQGQLHIYNQQARAFLSTVGFPCSEEKNAQAREIVERPFEGARKNPRAATVTSIVKDEIVTVYDITEPVTRSVIAEGMVAHNCNLASINLAHFYNAETTTFDAEGFRHACRVWTVVLEVSVLMAQFPSKAIAQKSYDFRTLGLGYANLGTVLMTAGIPYDSEQGRAWAGAITAVMTGESYAASAEMARDHGPFPGYQRNAKNMLRVIRNHRRAAYNVPAEEYEQLSVTPMGINPALTPQPLLDAARETWDRALALGEQYGYRNAQVSVLAPTGTIGLVMDCDTTGIEPDFALVKFKKLSGGGYFKIVNGSVPRALRTLGYTPAEIAEIERYAKGHGSIVGCPHINPEALRARGLAEATIEALDRQMATVFDIRFAFNKFTVGEEQLRALGATAEEAADPTLDVLALLGYTPAEIEAANLYICGTMTIEGAPGLRAEHLPVFDCATRCGRLGTRFIEPMGHVKMMAAAQPFISGAISKTINMPAEATIEEVDEVYMASWRLMLKAIALYRDGSKLSQPLNATADSGLVEEVTLHDVDAAHLAGNENTWDENVSMAQVQERIVEKVYHRAERRRLPKRRHGFVREATVGGHKVFLRTGEYEDGALGEIFIDMYKEGASFKGLMNCFAVLASKALQYGMPLEKMVDTFTFTRFEPSGPVQGHEAIKNATSIIDYVFRAIGYEYLGREDFVHVKAVDETEGSDYRNGGKNGAGRAAESRTGAKVSPGQALYAQQQTGRNGDAGKAHAVNGTTTNGATANGTSTSGTATKSAAASDRSVATARAQGYTGDQCGNCGSMRVKQNGACHVCEDCGTTSGCS